MQLDPRWHQAFYLFVKEGFFHILDGIDHLLFLLCLVIPFRQFPAARRRGDVVHGGASMTLIASAFGMAPDALVVPAADRDADRDLDRLHGASRTSSAPNCERRWMITFAFGLCTASAFRSCCASGCSLPDRTC